MTRRTQRYVPTQIASRRFRVLVFLADGRWRTMDELPRPVTYGTVRSLEDRGLIQVDRTRRALRMRIVLPEQAWLSELERWFERELQEGAR